MLRSRPLSCQRRCQLHAVLSCRAQTDAGGSRCHLLGFYRLAAAAVGTSIALSPPPEIMKSTTPSPISLGGKDCPSDSIIFKSTRPRGKRQIQTFRAWIDREKPGQPFLSKVSFMKKIHMKSTGTTIRSAALDFNLLHARELMNGRMQANPNTAPRQQDELTLNYHEQP